MNVLGQKELEEKADDMAVNKKEKVANESVEEALIVQDTNNDKEIVDKTDYKLLFDKLLPLALDDKRLVNFSYFLYKMNYVKEYENSEGWLGLKKSVNFCDCAKDRSFNNAMNHSRLEQQYTVDIFPGDYYSTVWRKKEDLPDSIVNACVTCKLKGEKQLSFCPYFFTYIVEKMSEESDLDIEGLYRMIMGSELINFCGNKVNRISCVINPDDIKDINSKSAHAAYIMLASEMIKVTEKGNDFLDYTYLPLCKGENKRNIISDIVDFWDTGVGIHNQVPLYNLNDILYLKTDGCRKCNFEQCPHKLAAYFVYLSDKYNVDVIDLAYYIAFNNTYAGVTVSQNFQFNKFIEIINNSPMKSESKSELIKVIYYIVARDRNSNIPFLPFNVAITSPDMTNAEEVERCFVDAIWFFNYFKVGSDNTLNKTLHLASVSFDELIAEYENAKEGTTLLLRDVHLLCQNGDFKKGYHKFLKLIEGRKQHIVSTLIGEKDDVETFFNEFPELKKKIFTKIFDMSDLSSEVVHEKLIDKLLEIFDVSEDIKERLMQYINIVYPSSCSKGMEFVDDLYEKLLFNHYNHDVNASNELYANDIPYTKPPRSERAIFEEIDKLIGLTNVKQQLHEVNDLVKFNLKLGNNGKNRANMHMIFYGNPGTGKTTVARLTAEILHSIGFIQENKLVICSAKDLIGEYLGQTAPKTAKKCEEAYNGVLFIDEAYQLNPYTTNLPDPYKEECIAELIQQMENNRDKMVVIFAGYTNEMKLLEEKANTGFKSRIGPRIEFPDYTTDELIEIFEKIVKNAGLELDKGAREKAIMLFAKERVDSESFGNARFARNMFESSLMKHAVVTSDLDKDNPELRVIKAAEITVS